MRGCLLALLPVLALALSGETDTKCSLSGHVTNALSGEPLKKATLHLRATYFGDGRPPASPPSNYFAVSENDGSFRFLNVKPGIYSLSAEHAGFLEMNYGAKKPGGSGQSLSLDPGHPISDMAIALQPEGIITGRVLDRDGDPLSTGMVTAFAKDRSGGKAGYIRRNEAGVNDRGEFRMQLPPDKYLVCVETRPPDAKEIRADGKTNMHPITTFYPDATMAADAATVEVHGGQETGGIDIHVRDLPLVHIRGKVQGPGSPNMQVFARSGNSLSSPTWGELSSYVQKDGGFDIPGITAGSYEIELSIQQENGRRMAGAQHVNVGAVDVNNIVLNVVPPGRLRGTVRVEGRPPANSAPWNPASVRLEIELYEPGTRYIPEPLMTKPDGTFASPDLSPAMYTVSALNGPEGAYLASVLFNNQEALDKPMDLSQGGSGDVEVIFRYGAAQISGVVRLPRADAGNAPATVPEVGIVLLSENRTTQRSGIDLAIMQPDHTFTFRNVAPGRYRVYAAEQDDAGSFSDPAVANAMLDTGAEVEVSENEKRQIEVRLISSEEVQQSLARMGMEVQ